MRLSTEHSVSVHTDAVADLAIAISPLAGSGSEDKVLLAAAPDVLCFEEPRMQGRDMVLDYNDYHCAHAHQPPNDGESAAESPAGPADSTRSQA